MTFDHAARVQYRRNSYYAVLLCGPNGERETLGSSQSKSGSGLLRYLAKEHVQERVKRFPDAESLRCTKSATRLTFSNGWYMEFGGTIRQEAS